MTRLQQELQRYWAEAVIALAVVTFLVGLIVLGVVWLAENDRLIELTVVTVALPLLLFLVRKLRASAVAGALGSAELESDSAADRRARKATNKVIESVQPEDVESLESIQDLVARVIDGVSRAYHPEDKDARLRFTIPEGMHLIEDVCSRLRAAILEDLPALQHVDIRLMVSGSRVYDGYTRISTIYRVVRLLNPATAIAAEVRQLLLDAAISSLSRELKIRFAGAIAREVGEVLMRLYNGEYRKLSARPARKKARLLEHLDPEPLRILVAGQARSGKSALINALVGFDALATDTSPVNEPLAVEMALPDVGAVHLIEAPTEFDVGWETLIRDVDLAVWVAASNRADRAADGRALNRLRAIADADARLKRTPVVLALTHADRLTPPMEWAPPYDIEGGERLKERNMRASREAAIEALDIPKVSCAVVAVGDPTQPWNLDSLRCAINANATTARQKRLERMTRSAGWKEAVLDTVRTVPGGLKRGYKVLSEGASAKEGRSSGASL